MQAGLPRALIGQPTIFLLITIAESIRPGCCCKQQPSHRRQIGASELHTSWRCVTNKFLGDLACPLSESIDGFYQTNLSSNGMLGRAEGQFGGVVKSIGSHCCGVCSDRDQSLITASQPTAMLQTGRCHITLST